MVSCKSLPLDSRTLWTSALQSVMLSPVELVKICLQLQTLGNHRPDSICEGPVCIAINILKKEGVRDIYRELFVARAFVVNGAIFSAYELALRFMVNNSYRIRLES